MVKIYCPFLASCFTCGGMLAPKREATPSRVIGIQHMKSVSTISVILRAMALSDFCTGERAAARVRLATTNIHIYAKEMVVMDTKFTTRKITTEYYNKDKCHNVYQKKVL